MMYGQNFYGQWAAPIGMNWMYGIGGLFFAAIIVWSIAWKGLALWKAAHENSKVWFIVLLIVNTLGILEILYIYIFSKKPGVPNLHEGEHKA